jgi:hypothetical protein
MRALPDLAEQRVDPLAGKSSAVPAKYSRARGLSEVEILLPWLDLFMAATPCRRKKKGQKLRCRSHFSVGGRQVTVRYSTGSAKEHVNHPLPAHRDVAVQSRLQQAQLPDTPKSFSSSQPEPSCLFFPLELPPKRGTDSARIVRRPLVAMTMKY